jgi:putative transposase
LGWRGIRYLSRTVGAAFNIKPHIIRDMVMKMTINGLCKAELIRRRTPSKTKEAMTLAALECVSWFNHHRLPELVGHIPVAGAEANHERQPSNQAGAVAA